MPKKKAAAASSNMMAGSDMIIRVIAEQGVRTVFGYNGGAILPTYDAIFRYNEGRKKKEQIDLVVPANEQGAGFMASGYARATGEVGVFLVTSGPGATNCTTPVRDCMADSVPVVLISGQVARSAIGTDAFQEAPVYNIMGACAKHVFLVSDEDELEATIRTAFKIARTGRPGPVVIDIPKDVQNHVGAYRGEGDLEFKGYDHRMAKLSNARLSEQDVKSFYKLLAASNRPLLYVGGGVISGSAAAELRTFANRFKIPVVTTLLGIGSVDTTDPLSLHMLGMHGTAYANYAVDECDLLIAVGARFDDRVAGKVEEFAPHAKIAHIDIDAAEIGKVKGVEWAHVGDAKQALAALLRGGKGIKTRHADWANHVKALKQGHPLDYNRDSSLIQPQYVLEQLNEMTKGDAIVCTGVGQHQMWSAQYFDFHQPRSFITSGSMGTMGFGLPSAIGAQIGRPDKLVFDIDGDGSMRMNIGELETATSYGVPVKVLLLNNQGDGMVLQWQRLYYGHRYAGTDKTLRRKDFIKAAEADGFEFAKRVTDKGRVRKALDQFISYDGPAFLEVMTDQDADVFPMVGPGEAYKDMITGPFISERSEAIEEAEEAAGPLGHDTTDSVL